MFSCAQKTLQYNKRRKIWPPWWAVTRPRSYQIKLTYAVPQAMLFKISPAIFKFLRPWIAHLGFQFFRVPETLVHVAALQPRSDVAFLCVRACNKWLCLVFFFGVCVCVCACFWLKKLLRDEAVCSVFLKFNRFFVFFPLPLANT